MREAFSYSFGIREGRPHSALGAEYPPTIVSKRGLVQYTVAFGVVQNPARYELYRSALTSRTHAIALKENLSRRNQTPVGEA